MNSNPTSACDPRDPHGYKPALTCASAKRRKNRSAFILTFCLLLSCFLPGRFLAQNLTPAPIATNWEFNTGVIPGSLALAPITSLDTWQVSVNGGGYVPAIIINPPPLNTSICLGWSAPTISSQWITAPSLSCSGILGNYVCGPAVTDLTFRKTFFLPANSVFHLDLGIYASDWVEEITVNGGAPVYNRNVLAPPYPSDRGNSIRFRWCSKWIYGGWNSVHIRVRTQPGINNVCKVAGMRIDSDNPDYFNISGPSLVCPATTNTYTMPSKASLSLALPANNYSWTIPTPGYSGFSTTNSLSLFSGPNSGTLTASIYSTTPQGLSCNAVGAFSITVVPPLTVTPTGTSVCFGQCTTLSVTGAVSYTWFTNGNIPFATGPSVTVCPAQNTIYTVRGTTSLGCVIVTTSNILVLPVSNISIGTSTTSLCRGLPVTLTAFGTPATYTWTSPPGTTSNSNPLVATPSVNTTYTLSNTNFNGCVYSQTVTIAVLPTPTVVVAASPSVICSGSSTTLTASGASTYSWAPLAWTTATANASPGITTTYSATGTGTNGCSNTATTQVVVFTTPMVSANPPFLCSGIINTLTAFGATSYTWTMPPLPGYATGSIVANTPTLVLPAAVNMFTICGTTAGCSACNSYTLTNGTPVAITAPSVQICTSTSPCGTLSATSPWGGAVSYTWQPGNIIGANATVCPTLNTTYTVSATSSMGCPSTSLVAVTITANCCTQPTTGLTLLSSFTGTLNNTAFLLNGPISVSGLSRLQDCEVFATPNAQIDVLPGAVLDLDHVHIFGCSQTMWNGIVVQDGGRITSDLGQTRIKNTMIEDALVAIRLENISVASSGNLPINIQRFIFNRNHVGIKIANSDPTVTSLPLGIVGCVFASRIMPYTTYPSPIVANSWASAETVPGSFWGNNPGLKVPSSATATNGLTPPYLLNGYPQANLKAPYTMQPGHIGIKIENIANDGGPYTPPGVEFGISISNFLVEDFNLFDGLGNGIDVTDASLSTAGNVFQNSQTYTSPALVGIFGGHGIQQRVTGLMNTRLELDPGSGLTFGNRFWNCVSGVSMYNNFIFAASNAIFRSDHSVATAGVPYTPGDTGIVINTNRFTFKVINCQFNNVSNGLVFSTHAWGTSGYSMPPGGAGVQGPGPWAGTHADYLEISKNYFGPEVLSSTPYSGGAANTSEYMDVAIQFSTEPTPFWSLVNYFSNVTSNRIDRAFRGISVNSMGNGFLSVAGNSVYIENDLTFGLPGYGIAAYNDCANLSIEANTLQAMSSLPSNNVALVYCENTQGPRIVCNRVSYSKFGFQFDGNNPSTVWEGNTMCANWAGLALRNNGIIGPQGTAGSPSANFWNSSCAPWGTFLAINQTYSDASNPTFSPLNVFAGAGFVPTFNTSVSGPAYAVGTSVFTTAAPNNTLNCNSFSYPPPPSWRLAGQTTSVEEQWEGGFNENSVSIFPNPTNGKLTIDYPQVKENIQLKVIDMTGKVVMQANDLSNTNNSIDVSELPAALYIIELKDGTQKTVRYKLVKTNY